MVNQPSPVNNVHGRRDKHKREKVEERTITSGKAEPGGQATVFCLSQTCPLDAECQKDQDYLRVRNVTPRLLNLSHPGVSKYATLFL